MTCIHELPRLVIVPVEDLILHEYHDDQRTPPLIEKLYSSGKLRNPPVVIPFRDHSDGFMVLDGANRVSAFRKSGIPHILVQVLERDDPNLGLNAWNHIVWGISPDKLYSIVRKIPDILLRPSAPSLFFQELKDLHAVACLHLPDGNIFTAFSLTMDLTNRVKLMNQVVSDYIEAASMDRTSIFQVESLLHLYENLAGLVLLPILRLSDVMDVVSDGQLMPPGCTRFTITPRVLHVNYPLCELESNKTLEDKNVDLKEFICDLLAGKSLRFYEEPTYIFND